MSDDRFTPDPDEEANANGERPYLDVPPPGVRPAPRQPARPGLVSAEEIEAFIKREYPETQRPKRRLLRPKSWDKPEAEKSSAPEPPNDWRDR